MHRLVRVILTVRKQVPVLQALIADQQAEVQLASIVKVEKQVVVREEVQVNETIVVPIIEITVLREITALPVPGAVVPVVVAPVAVILVAVILVAVDLPGAMSLVDKQKDALLPEVREVIALKALPVLLKETAVQEDNLFLYYLYQSHCSSAVGELDFGFSPARLFRASPVTWMSGRILSASISLITPCCARRFAISL